MQYIYSRVSTEDQHTQAQVLELQRLYPEALVVTEVASGVKSRPELKKLIDSTLLPGDELIVYSLDRLGRSTPELTTLFREFTARGIYLRSKREGIDLSTISGRFLADIMAAVADFERAALSERTKAGLRAARARGSQIGRVPTIPKDVVDQALAAIRQGEKVKAVARRHRVSEGYLYELLRNSKNKPL